MSSLRPKINIERLREIGWSLWDPIGLDGNSGIWREESFADEYDTYLVKAAGMLRNQCDVVEVVNYLFVVETEHMGLRKVNDEASHGKRLLRVAQAISNDPLVWSGSKSVDHYSKL